jgi:predicted nucleic acid-binding protein
VILVDTMVWARWLRNADDRAVTPLGPLVEDGAAAWHPIIRGELLLGAAGRLSAKRFALLDDILAALPKLAERSTDEVCAFISEHQLEGSGIGIADAHVALAAFENRVSLWTMEAALSTVARRLRLPVFR